MKGTDTTLVDHSWDFEFALVTICWSLSLSIVTFVVSTIYVGLSCISLRDMAISVNYLNWFNINLLIFGGFYMSLFILLLSF